MSITITDSYGDTFEVTPYSTTGGLEVGDFTDTFFDIDRDEVVRLRDACNEALSESTINVDSVATETRVAASSMPLNEALLRLAILHGRTVRFAYAKGDGSVLETRRFTPENLHRSREGNLSFRGPDPDRSGETRNFRVDRIKGDVEFA